MGTPDHILPIARPAKPPGVQRFGSLAAQRPIFTQHGLRRFAAPYFLGPNIEIR